MRSPRKQQDFVGVGGLGRAAHAAEGPVPSEAWVATEIRGFPRRNAAPPEPRRRAKKLLHGQVSRREEAGASASRDALPRSSHRQAPRMGECTGFASVQASPIKRRARCLFEQPPQPLMVLQQRPTADLQSLATCSPQRTRPDAAGCEA